VAFAPDFVLGHTPPSRVRGLPRRSMSPAVRARLVFGVLLGCWAGAAYAAGPQAMRLFDPQGKLLLELAADGRVRGADGAELGLLDERAGRLTWKSEVGEPLVLAFRDDDAVLEEAPDRYRVKPWEALLRVAPDGSISLDGKAFGRVEGYSADRASHERFRAALVALPLLPAPKPPPARDAGSAAPRAPAPPPPPPPPPPRPKH